MNFDPAYEIVCYGHTLRRPAFVQYADLCTIEHHQARVLKALDELKRLSEHLTNLRADRLIGQQQLSIFGEEEA